MRIKPWITILLILAVILGMAAWLTGRQTASQLFSIDTDNNGLKERYALQEQAVQVFERSRQIWKTPDEWQVQQILVADIDNNQQKELLLVLWKKGSFGDVKPFWLKGPDNKISCHLFVYRMRSGRMKAIWCSSALQYPIIKLAVKDSNADGLNELQVIEGPEYGPAYRLQQIFRRQHTEWVWNGWGFERV